MSEESLIIPKEGDNIVVWFSCGAASAVAAKLTVEKYGSYCNVILVNNPIKEEDPDNMRFLLDVQRWVDRDIIFATNTNYPSCSCVEVWETKKFMSGIHGAPCTVALKKEARYQYELKNKVDWHVMGFTADEKTRHERFVKSERENVIPLLIEAGLTKDQCFEILIAAGIELPMMYKMRYPNANCPGCSKATSPTYWNLVRRMHPKVFQQRAEQSRRLGAKLVRYKGKRIFLDELPPYAEGRSLKSLKMPECGIFCEETRYTKF